MEKVFFIAHVDEQGGLSRTALEALSGAMTLATALGCSLAVGLFGSPSQTEIQSAADSVANCGAEAFFGVAGADFAQARYASDAAACEALAKAAQATIVLAPATSRLSRALPGAAHRLGGRIDTQATEIAADGDAAAITRWYYRQRMFAQLTRTERPWFVTVAPCCFTPFGGGAGSAQVTAVDADGSAGRTTVVGLESPAADEQTIRPDADLLFVAGAGWTKKQGDGATHVPRAEGLIKSFLDTTKSSLGSSKSLVDISGEGADVISFLTHLHQVGQTGATPRHAKGLATCCHGEEPHVVGWRFINERRAVNLDAGCGWAQGKADVLYVADAFEVMAKVNELLA